VLNLSKFGLLPKIFGEDISKVFKQKYSGDLTLFPRFNTMQIFGLKALANPTVEEMDLYLRNGQSSAWPYLNVIKEMIRLESAIEKCIRKLSEQLEESFPLNSQSLNSSSDGRYETKSPHRQMEFLKNRICALEDINLQLRRQLKLDDTSDTLTDHITFSESSDSSDFFDRHMSAESDSNASPTGSTVDYYDHLEIPEILTQRQTKHFRRVSWEIRNERKKEDREEESWQ